jgi:hypothetical protein
MQITISSGEALDRLTILDIKESEIKDPTKLVHIQNEKRLYVAIQDICTKHIVLYDLLKLVNKRIWDKTNEIKAITPRDPPYADLAHEIFELNQHRFRLKMAINRITSATICEQKSYVANSICLRFPIITQADVVDIVYCFLHYDELTIETAADHPILGMLGLSFSRVARVESLLVPDIDRTTDYYKKLTQHLSHLFPPMVYIAGGLLGDFIHQLSVVCENFHATGRRGVLMITNDVGDPFRLGLERAYSDLLPAMTSCYYIQDFSIYKQGTPFEIDLSRWRENPTVYRGSWYDIFRNQYGVTFGKHPWLSGNKRSEFIGKTIVSTSTVRLVGEYPKLHELIDPANSVFVALDEQAYRVFERRFGIQLPFVLCNSLTEMIDIISSGELFIGNLSSPLTFAYAIHKKCIILKSHTGDDIHIAGLNQHLPFIQEYIS